MECVQSEQSRDQNDVNSVSIVKYIVHFTYSAPFTDNFIVNFTYSGPFIVNLKHVSHLARRAICRNTSFIMEKTKKSNKFNRL